MCLQKGLEIGTTSFWVSIRPIRPSSRADTMPATWAKMLRPAETFCLWITTLNGENSVKCNAGAIGTTAAICGFEDFAAQRVHLATTNQFVWNIWSAVATPKAFGGHRFRGGQAGTRAKAPSPLRSAGALHMVAVSRRTSERSGGQKTIAGRCKAWDEIRRSYYAEQR